MLQTWRCLLKELVSDTMILAGCLYDCWRSSSLVEGKLLHGSSDGGVLKYMPRYVCHCLYQ